MRHINQQRWLSGTTQHRREVLPIAIKHYVTVAFLLLSVSVLGVKPHHTSSTTDAAIITYPPYKAEVGMQSAPSTNDPFTPTPALAG